MAGATPHRSPDLALNSAELDTQVIELKRQGHTFRQISEQLQLSKSQVHRAFHRGLNRIPADNVQAYRDEQLQHIALAREVVLDVLASYTQNVAVTKDGDVIPIDEDQAPLLAAAATLVKLDDHEAKLLGMYAKTEVNHTGSLTYEIAGVDLSKLT